MPGALRLEQVGSGRQAPTGEAPDPAVAWRRARSRVARRHHPDLGGDLDEYLAALDEVDARFGRRPSRRASEPGSGSAGSGLGVVRTATGPLVSARRARNRLWRRVRAGVRNARSRLPRRVPGSRRYTTL